MKKAKRKEGAVKHRRRFAQTHWTVQEVLNNVYGAGGEMTKEEAADWLADHEEDLRQSTIDSGHDYLAGEILNWLMDKGRTD